ncbi:hypothetical protein HYH03_003448 [Edaphochlamys debaryana]|uniref:Uncharacterized protein n=1 Tax=Edaphochlamys debaryana TaxID=47281 RepID=A0A835Y9U4_9CHLO|nr:hypothetical protein HYH03_003448 [Edaphochlamys debaryana]|eukprot:KAG2498708.1 hypothetical protein HYH03_003448 [Edaphochlamys debaryana]
MSCAVCNMPLALARERGRADLITVFIDCVELGHQPSAMEVVTWWSRLDEAGAAWSREDSTRAARLLSLCKAYVPSAQMVDMGRLPALRLRGRPGSAGDGTEPGGGGEPRQQREGPGGGLTAAPAALPGLPPTSPLLALFRRAGGVAGADADGGGSKPCRSHRAKPVAAAAADGAAAATAAVSAGPFAAAGGRPPPLGLLWRTGCMRRVTSRRRRPRRKRRQPSTSNLRRSSRRLRARRRPSRRQGGFHAAAATAAAGPSAEAPSEDLDAAELAETGERPSGPVEDAVAAGEALAASGFLGPEDDPRLGQAAEEAEGWAEEEDGGGHFGYGGAEEAEEGHEGGSEGEGEGEGGVGGEEGLGGGRRALAPRALSLLRRLRAAFARRTQQRRQQAEAKAAAAAAAAERRMAPAGPEEAEAEGAASGAASVETDVEEAKEEDGVVVLGVDEVVGGGVRRLDACRAFAELLVLHSRGNSLAADEGGRILYKAVNDELMQAKHLDELIDAYKSNSSMIDVIALSTTWMRLGKLGVSGSSRYFVVDERALTLVRGSLLSKTLARVPDMTVRQVSNVLWAMGKLRFKLAEEKNGPYLAEQTEERVLDLLRKLKGPNGGFRSVIDGPQLWLGLGMCQYEWSTTLLRELLTLTLAEMSKGSRKAGWGGIAGRKAGAGGAGGGKAGEGVVEVEGAGAARQAGPRRTPVEAVVIVLSGAPQRESREAAELYARRNDVGVSVVDKSINEDIQQAKNIAELGTVFLRNEASIKLARLGGSGRSAPPNPAAVAFARQRLLSKTLARVPDMGMRQLANVLWAMGKLRMRLVDEKHGPLLAEHIEERIMELLDKEGGFQQVSHGTQLWLGLGLRQFNWSGALLSKLAGFTAAEVERTDRGHQPSAAEVQQWYGRLEQIGCRWSSEDFTRAARMFSMCQAFTPTPEQLERVVQEAEATTVSMHTRRLLSCGCVTGLSLAAAAKPRQQREGPAGGLTAAPGALLGLLPTSPLLALFHRAGVAAGADADGGCSRPHRRHRANPAAAAAADTAAAATATVSAGPSAAAGGPPAATGAALANGLHAEGGEPSAPSAAEAASAFDLQFETQPPKAEAETETEPTAGGFHATATATAAAGPAAGAPSEDLDTFELPETGEQPSGPVEDAVAAGEALAASGFLGPEDDPRLGQGAGELEGWGKEEDGGGHFGYGGAEEAEEDHEGASEGEGEGEGGAGSGGAWAGAGGRWHLGL